MQLVIRNKKMNETVADNLDTVLLFDLYHACKRIDRPTRHTFITCMGTIKHWIYLGYHHDMGIRYQTQIPFRQECIT